MSEKLPWPSHWPAPKESEEVLLGWATALVNGSGGNAYEYACLAHAYLTQKKDAERYRWLRRRDSEHAEYLIGLYAEKELDEKIDEELRRLIEGKAKP